MIENIKQKTNLLNQKIKEVFDVVLPNYNIVLMDGISDIGRLDFRNEQYQYNKSIFLKYQQWCLTNVVPHEVAHLASSIIYQDLSHGKNWRHIMKIFNVSPRVYHPF